MGQVTKPDALALADSLEAHSPTIGPDATKAAAELRRLHAENEALLIALRNLVTSVKTQHNLTDAIGWADEAIAMAVFADAMGAAMKEQTNG
jgi:ABC-type transporter Mla subunit MlaD